MTNDIALQDYKYPPKPVTGTPTTIRSGEVVAVGDGWVDIRPVLSRASKMFVPYPAGYTPTVGDSVLYADLHGDEHTPVVIAVYEAQAGGSDPVDGPAGVPSLRTLGTGSQQAAAGNDSRFTNARTPTAHATSHLGGGSDPILGTFNGNSYSADVTASLGEFVRMTGAHTVTLPAGAASGNWVAVVALTATVTVLPDSGHHIVDDTGSGLSTASVPAGASAIYHYSNMLGSWVQLTRADSRVVGGDLNGTLPNPTVDGLQGRSVAATAPSSGQAVVWNGSTWTPTTLAASQITNAADTSSSSAQTFTGNVGTPALSVSGLSGATSASRYVGATASGAPTSGAFLKGDWCIDQSGRQFVCATAGSPGTWVDVSSLRLLASNNLSDVANRLSTLINLGFSFGADSLTFSSSASANKTITGLAFTPTGATATAQAIVGTATCHTDTFASGQFRVLMTLSASSSATVNFSWIAFH